MLTWLFFAACEGPGAAPGADSKTVVPADSPSDSTTESDTDTDTDTDSDTDADTDTDTDTDLPPIEADYMLAYTTTDLSDGQLALANPANRDLDDGVITTAAGAHLAYVDGSLWILGADAADTVEIVDATDPRVPLLSLSLASGATPYDAVSCAGYWFVSQRTPGTLAVFDTAGTPVGEVDFPDQADLDGSAEPEDLHSTGSVVWVALQRTNTFTGLSDDGTGRLVGIDCASFLPIHDVVTGPLPQIFPGTDASIFVITGERTLDGSSPALDGGLFSLDTGLGTLDGPHLTESELGANLDGLYVGSDGSGILVTNDAFSWATSCINVATWDLTSLTTDNAWIPSGAVGSDNAIWLSIRAGQGTGTAPTTGLRKHLGAACAYDSPLHTALDPYDVVTIQ